MACHGGEQRRDPRYNLKRGCAFADFDDPGNAESRWCGQLCSLSVAGIALQVDASIGLTVGAVLPHVALRIGDCRLTGSIVVRNVLEIDADQSSIGGLFYPESETEVAKLMALLAGMDAVESVSELRAFDVAEAPCAAAAGGGPSDPSDPST